MDVEQIKAIRLQTLLQIEELVTTTGPTIIVNEEQVLWAPLVESLQRTLDWCDRKLQELEPFEIHSQATT